MMRVKGLLMLSVLLFVAACGGGNGGGTSSTVKRETVTGIKAAAGDARNLITWEPTSGAASYNVYTSQTSPVTSTSSKSTGITDTFYSATSLTNGTTYYHRVTSVSTSGQESSLADSAEISVKPQAPSAAPQAPASVNAMFSSGQVVLAWGPVPDAATYNIYWGTAAGVTVSSASNNKKGIIGTTSTITGLTNGATYYLIVTAVNSLGESAPSTEIVAYPQVVPASAGSSVSAPPSGITQAQKDAQTQDSAKFRFLYTNAGVKNIGFKYDDDEYDYRTTPAIWLGAGRRVCYSQSLPIDTTNNCFMTTWSAGNVPNNYALSADAKKPLKIGVPYFFTVDDYDWLGNRRNFPIAVAIPKYKVSAPKNVTITPSSDGKSAVLSWAPAIDASNQQWTGKHTLAVSTTAIDTSPFQWGAALESGFPLTGGLTYSGPTYSSSRFSVTIKGLTPGTTYNFAVAACDNESLYGEDYVGGMVGTVGCSTAEEPALISSTPSTAQTFTVATGCQESIAPSTTFGATTNTISYSTTKPLTFKWTSKGGQAHAIAVPFMFDIVCTSATSNCISNPWEYGTLPAGTQVAPGAPTTAGTLTSGQSYTVEVYYDPSGLVQSALKCTFVAP